MSKIIQWFIGKKILTETGQMDAISKTKLIAIIGVILGAIEPVSAAWGHPIHIPDSVYKILGAAGLWAARDAIKS